MTGRATRTARLLLSPLTLDDLGWMFDLFNDPRGWTHFPEGRHADQSMTEAFLRNAAEGWARDGLCYWSARLLDDTAVGMGGVRTIQGRWNLGFRIRFDFQGNGYATEIARAALLAAHSVEPTRPVVAWVDEVNVVSQRVAERIGLTNVGLHHDGDDELLAYADRPIALA